MEWVAAEFHHDPTAKINTLIAIPYNPYHPKPYDRWTMKGIFDLPREILIAEDFWNFLGGDENTYQQLLDCFEEAGIELRPEIDQYFQKFS